MLLIVWTIPRFWTVVPNLIHAKLVHETLHRHLPAWVYFFDSNFYMLSTAEVQSLKALVNCSDFILHMYGLILLVLLAVLEMLICSDGYHSFHALSILTDLMHLAYEAMIVVLLIISPLSVFLARVKKDTCA